LETLSVREHELGSSEVRIFTGSQTGALDLVSLESQEIDASRLLPLVELQRTQLGSNLLKDRISFTDGRAVGRSSCKLVEQIEMSIGIGEHLMLVLAMELDEALRELATRGCGCQRSVDECTTATLGSDFAPYDDFATVTLELRFDFCQLCSGSYELTRRAAAEQ
jgi:hypothetical protein